MAFTSSITWSISSPRYAELSKTYHPASIHLLRAIFAVSFTFLLILFINDAPLEIFHQITLTHLQWLFLSVICSYALGDIFFLYACQYAGVSTGLAIASSYPIWSAILSVAILHQAVTWKIIVGTLLVVTGVFSVIMLSNKTHQIYSKKNFGILLAFITSFFWAFNTLSTSKGSEGIPATTACFFRMLIALVAVPIIGLIITRRVQAIIPRTPMLKSFIFFFLEGFMGPNLYIYGMSHSNLAVASALSSLAPILVLPVLWMKKMEAPSIRKALAILTTVLGIILLVL